MPLSLSKRADFITQAEIRVMTIECEKVGGINLAQGVCDTEVPLAVRRGAQAAMDAETRYHPDRIARQTLAFYRRVIDGRAPRITGSFSGHNAS